MLFDQSPDKETHERQVEKKETSKLGEFENLIHQTLTGKAKPKRAECPQENRILSFGGAAGAPAQVRALGPSQQKTLQDICAGRLVENSPDWLAEPKKERQVPVYAEKVLDAPDLIDDFYLNLLDWNEKNVLAISLSQTIYMLNTTTSDIATLNCTRGNDFVTSVAWMPGTHNILAIGTSNSTVQLWDTDKGVQLRQLNGHTYRVSSLAWNGSLLSTGSLDTSIVNFDVRSRVPEVSRFCDHQQEVCGLKWSPDGTQLASGGNDNVLCVWDASGPQQPLFKFS